MPVAAVAAGNHRGRVARHIGAGAGRCESLWLRRGTVLPFCFMGRIPDTIEWAAIAAGVVLVCFVLAKINAVRFRKRAVEVSGEVLKIFGHRQHTSYFIRYWYGGSPRIAEYAGLPLVREFKEGEQVQILIDRTAPPDVPVPDVRHSASSGGGNCQLPGRALVSLWDLLVVVICIYMLGRYFASVH